MLPLYILINSYNFFSYSVAETSKITEQVNLSLTADIFTDASKIPSISPVAAANKKKHAITTGNIGRSSSKPHQRPSTSYLADRKNVSKAELQMIESNMSLKRTLPFKLNSIWSNNVGDRRPDSPTGFGDGASTDKPRFFPCEPTQKPPTNNNGHSNNHTSSDGLPDIQKPIKRKCKRWNPVVKEVKCVPVTPKEGVSSRK